MYSKQWPNITKKKDAMPEHKEYDPETYKEDKTSLLSEKPGPGD